MPAGLAVERCRLGELFARLPRLSYRFWVGLIILSSLFNGSGYAQTGSTGALDGIALDPSNAVISGVSIQVQKESGGDAQSTFSDENGRFVIQLLPPGSYRLKASKNNFRPLILSHLYVYVTETLRLELHLQLVEHAERSEVSSSPQMLQTSIRALGRIVNEAALQSLPLATRNFAQIIGLSPGVSVSV